MYRVWNYITTYSLLLIGGALLALIWANTNPDSYHHFVHYVLFDTFFIGELHE
ncbi:MAG: sodium:proton antiporter, partial [Rhodobacteraceae bacterium]|nr:sodium:proton antiporter [Paracoccaceae bacterium]